MGESIINIKYRLILLLVALIWGAAFVAQRVSNDTMGPFAFNAVRNFLGALSILPAVFWRSESAMRPKPPVWLTLPRACIFLGLMVFGGTACQQIGMLYTTAGKASCITALYIVAVPIAGLLIRQPLRLLHVVGLTLAVLGLYLLAFKPEGGLNIGDLFELCGVLFWCFSIQGVGVFVKYYPGLLLSFFQLLICALCNFVCMLIVGETLSWSIIQQTVVPILYSGILSSGVAYTLQIVGQQHVSPTEASLLLSMEMVFGALSGYLFLGEVMTSRELLGCIIMACGIFAAQIPSRIIWQRGPSVELR